MKTAVEYLVGYITSDGGFDLQAVIEQAKEMELEKLKEAYSMGRLNKSIKEFNETFKNTNK